MVHKTARLFQNGRSQAVRLPKEFRFKGEEVRISRDKDRVILEPMEQGDWGDAFWQIFGAFGEDFELGDRTQQQARVLFP
jgi:antitoxin VapB